MHLKFKFKYLDDAEVLNVFIERNVCDAIISTE